MKRMWINQPSTIQLYHELHGINVLVSLIPYDATKVIVYFLSGPITSQIIPKETLSDRWVDDNQNNSI